MLQTSSGWMKSSSVWFLILLLFISTPPLLVTCEENINVAVIHTLSETQGGWLWAVQRQLQNVRGFNVSSHQLVDCYAELTDIAPGSFLLGAAATLLGVPSRSDVTLVPIGSEAAIGELQRVRNVRISGSSSTDSYFSVRVDSCDCLGFAAASLASDVEVDSGPPSVALSLGGFWEDPSFWVSFLQGLHKSSVSSWSSSAPFAVLEEDERTILDATNMTLSAATAPLVRVVSPSDPSVIAILTVNAAVMSEVIAEAIHEQFHAIEESKPRELELTLNETSFAFELHRCQVVVGGNSSDVEATPSSFCTQVDLPSTSCESTDSDGAIAASTVVSVPTAGVDIYALQGLAAPAGRRMNISISGGGSSPLKLSLQTPIHNGSGGVQPSSSLGFHFLTAETTSPLKPHGVLIVTTPSAISGSLTQAMYHLHPSHNSSNGALLAWTRIDPAGSSAANIEIDGSTLATVSVRREGGVEVYVHADEHDPGGRKGLWRISLRESEQSGDNATTSATTTFLGRADSIAREVLSSEEEGMLVASLLPSASASALATEEDPKSVFRVAVRTQNYFELLTFQGSQEESRTFFDLPQELLASSPLLVQSVLHGDRLYVFAVFGVSQDFVLHTFIRSLTPRYVAVDSDSDDGWSLLERRLPIYVVPTTFSVFRKFQESNSSFGPTYIHVRSLSLGYFFEIPRPTCAANFIPTLNGSGCVSCIGQCTVAVDNVRCVPTVCRITADKGAGSMIILVLVVLGSITLLCCLVHNRERFRKHQQSHRSLAKVTEQLLLTQDQWMFSAPNDIDDDFDTGLLEVATLLRCYRTFLPRWVIEDEASGAMHDSHSSGSSKAILSRSTKSSRRRRLYRLSRDILWIPPVRRRLMSVCGVRCTIYDHSTQYIKGALDRASALLASRVKESQGCLETMIGDIAIISFGGALENFAHFSSAVTFCARLSEEDVSLKVVTAVGQGLAGAYGRTGGTRSTIIGPVIRDAFDLLYYHHQADVSTLLFFDQVARPSGHSTPAATSTSRASLSSDETMEDESSTSINDPDLVIDFDLAINTDATSDEHVHLPIPNATIRIIGIETATTSRLLCTLLPIERAEVSISSSAASKNFVLDAAESYAYYNSILRSISRGQVLTLNDINWGLLPTNIISKLATEQLHKAIQLQRLPTFHARAAGNIGGRATTSDPLSPLKKSGPAAASNKPT